MSVREPASDETKPKSRKASSKKTARGESRPAVQGSSAVVPKPPTEGGDTLTRYMAELAHHPPISREEEHELAVRWHEEGDIDAARKLVMSNLRLVVKIAMEYRRAWANTLDLIQEGNLGLMQAVHRFDPYQGVKLSSYGVYWIRAYILKYILDNIRIVRLGKTRAERKLFYNLNKEKRELERLGFEPEPRLLAERLDVSEEDVVSMEQRLSQGELSMSAPLRRDDDSGAELGDMLAAPTESAEQSVADAQLRKVFLEKVREFSEGCDEREKRILEERLLAEEPRTLAELGEEFGVSRERVRQLESRLMKRLQEHMKEHLVDFEFYAAPQD
ncbi:MAG: sigma-70 family RNA polymerase sigma factor [Myxococcota bacterium]